MAIDRKAMKAQLVARTNESNQKKDADSSVPFEKYLELPTTVDGNGEVSDFPLFSMFKQATELGKTIEIFFNIVPFVVGNKYPTVDYSYKAGQWAYMLDLWIHTNVGPENKRVVCPKRNYNKPCPICEAKNERLSEASTKEERREIYKELDVKRRSIYFVRISEGETDKTEYNKGVQVMDAPYAWMEQELQKEATLPRGGGIIPYAMDTEEGREIMFNVKKTGEGFYTVDNHKLLERDYEITDEELEQTFPLDECIKLHSYDKLSAMYYGESEDDGFEEAVGEAEAQEYKIPEEVPMGDDVPLEEEQEEEKVLECPVGGEFGVDYSMFEGDCESCKIEMDCKIEKQNIIKAKKATMANKAGTASKRKRPNLG